MSAALRAESKSAANKYPDGGPAERTVWRAREDEIRREFATDLAEFYLPNLPTLVRAAVFSLAWDEGHSSGYSEVEHQYENLSALVNLTAQQVTR